MVDLAMWLECLIGWFEADVGYGLSMPNCILLLLLRYQCTGVVYQPIADSLSVCVFVWSTIY